MFLNLDELPHEGIEFEVRDLRRGLRVVQEVVAVDLRVKLLRPRGYFRGGLLFPMSHSSIITEQCPRCTVYKRSFWFCDFSEF